MPRASVSSVIDAPVEQVWKRIRDFNALPQWHPAIKDSRIEDGLAPDKIGCIRNFNLRDGANFREQLLALSDRDHSYTYVILDSPFGVVNYVSTLKLTPVTDGDRCVVEWYSDFDCEPQRSQELVNTFRQAVYQAGFDALKSHFSRR
ncbi:SRPBCC family protein [Dongia soli]|uniref:SRPBCC family protein n=1 Tax=Dongia soli TaxID=600628 RepID=A0ABU5EH30_9PROT|nr:SRPBCC family protein [Dongia soli]MDY0885548.1 SRPBCC family protein [Dongia soli]